MKGPSPTALPGIDSCTRTPLETRRTSRGHCEKPEKHRVERGSDKTNGCRTGRSGTGWPLVTYLSTNILKSNRRTRARVNISSRRAEFAKCTLMSAVPCASKKWALWKPVTLDIADALYPSGFWASVPINLSVNIESKPVTRRVEFQAGGITRGG